LATIFGSSGSAKSTIKTESFPGGDKTGLPSLSHRIFSSSPTIMNGAARAAVTPRMMPSAAASFSVAS
jgi:hypothetical protein